MRSDRGAPNGERGSVFVLVLLLVLAGLAFFFFWGTGPAPPTVPPAPSPAPVGGTASGPASAGLPVAKAGPDAARTDSGAVRTAQSGAAQPDGARPDVAPQREVGSAGGAPAGLEPARYEALRAAATDLGLGQDAVQRIAQIMADFEAEVQQARELPESDRVELLRRRSAETIDALRAQFGEREINHLMSLGVLEPIARYAYPERPTVYPPPVPR